ncbi:MAG: dihydropteroate synthase [Pirellulales bacterium]
MRADPDPNSTSIPQLVARRAAHWQLKTRMLELPRRPLIMGIINVTPDSFSDGGQFFATSAAVDHALELIAEGADILDIGGESTRPYSEIVPAEEELRRVLPVVEAVTRQSRIPISIDTSKAAVAEAAIDAGVEIINDVTALTGDAAMLEVAVRRGAGICAMHMLGTPQTMQDNPAYDDVVAEVIGYLRSRREVLEAAGISRDRICLDPGIGFGKTREHNVDLMRHSYRLHALGSPVLVGHSRKGFLGKLIGDKDGDRTNATVWSSLSLAVQGVHVIRVHDVRLVREALTVFEATGGLT